MNYAELFAAALAALAAASLAVVYLRSSSRRAPDYDRKSATLLFDDGVLHHACDEAHRQFDLEPGADEWEDLRDRVIDHIPDFPERGAPEKMQYASNLVAIRERGTKTQVEFQELEALGAPSVLPQGPAQELELLRRIQQSVTHPIWHIDQRGDMIWANDAYRALQTKAAGESSNTGGSIFGALAEKDIPEDGLRVSFGADDSNDRDWFRIVATKVPNGTIFNATNLNAVVLAEEAQRNFVQTLAKTFAHLSTGLAIFDRKRQLMLFNPSLIDLTGLPAEFLSATPSIESFFDKLREHRRMPEPKNYKNWRQEITDVIAAANDGRYQETWSLETGQTYKVSGRPHPDGATAFIIEDISAEISETRNSRAELELSQCLLDTVGDAMAVFSRSGTLTFCNEGYRSMWNIDPATSFADFTVSDSIGIWSGSCAPNPMWQDIEDFVLGYGDRKSWDMPVRPLGQSLLRCEISPIVSGATLVRFCKSAETTPYRASTSSRSE